MRDYEGEIKLNFQIIETIACRLERMWKLYQEIIIKRTWNLTVIRKESLVTMF